MMLLFEHSWLGKTGRLVVTLAATALPWNFSGVVTATGRHVVQQTPPCVEVSHFGHFGHPAVFNPCFFGF